MRKSLVGLAIGFFALTATVEAYAISLVYHFTGQLGGINEVDINGTLWDATFYDRWSLSGQQTYDANFAQDASNALRYQFTHDSTLISDYLPTLRHQFIWGCEYQNTDCYLITPVFSSATTYGWTVRGYQYIVGGIVGDTGYLTDDANYVFSWVQWTESSIVDEDPELPIGGEVPEPGTLALLGLSLAGLAVSRRRKQ